MPHLAGGSPEGLLGHVIRQHIQICKINHRRIEVRCDKPCSRVIPELRLRQWMGIGVISQAPVHLSLHIGDGVEHIHNLPALVVQAVVLALVGHSPPVGQREIHPVIGICALDCRVNGSEGLLIRPYIGSHIRGPHIIPLLAVDLISNDPVGNLAVVRILPAVVIRQEGRDGPGLLKARLRGCVEHIIVGEGGLLRARIDQIRRVGIPVIQNNGSHRHALVGQSADGGVVGIHHRLIKMIGFSIIFKLDAGAHNLGKCDVGGHVLHAQIKGIAEHINLNIQPLLCQGILKGGCVPCHCLRIGDVPGLADGLKGCAVKYPQHKLIVEPVLAGSQVQGHRNLAGCACRSLAHHILGSHPALVGLKRKDVHLSVRSRRVPAGGKVDGHIALICRNGAGGDKSCKPGSRPGRPPEKPKSR